MNKREFGIEDLVRVISQGLGPLYGAKGVIEHIDGNYYLVKIIEFADGNTPIREHIEELYEGEIEHFSQNSLNNALSTKPVSMRLLLMGA